MNRFLPVFLLVMMTLGLVQPGPARAAGTSTNGDALFGLTNLWTIHLTLSRADWTLLGSRGGPTRMYNNGGGFNNNNNGNNGNGPGFFEGIVRGVIGANDSPPRPQNQPRNPRMAATPSEGNSRYPWGQCTFEAGGQVFTNVGIRLKGVSSVVRAPNGYKRPFKIDFNRTDKEQRFLGVHEIYLNNNVNDATQMREALAYEVFRRAGIPAPRTAFARVYLTIPGVVENQHLGLYTVVEVVEGDFLKRSFGSKKGLLMKPEQMHGLQYMGDDWGNYPQRYNPKGEVDPKEAARFIEFARFIQEADPERFRTHLKDYLDPEAFARFVGLNAILANVDSFIGNGHNYFLYIPPDTHKSNFIPWDLNESFGMHPVSGPSHDQMVTSVLRPNADPNRLVERFVVDPTFGNLYRAQLASLVTNVFIPSKLAQDIDRIAAVTKPVVFAESKRARADFERTVLGTMRPDEGDTSQPRHDREFRNDNYRPWGFPDAVEVDNMPLKEWIKGRDAHVREQLEGRSRGTHPRPRI